jgi:hypothetical protein
LTVSGIGFVPPLRTLSNSTSNERRLIVKMIPLKRNSWLAAHFKLPLPESNSGIGATHRLK